MALTSRRVFEARNAAQYTGQNSADFNTEIGDFTITNENASGLTFTSAGQSYMVAPNGYIAWYNGQVSEVFQNQDDYLDTYAEVDTEAALNHVHYLTTGPGVMTDANGQA
jgi:hypothetical protein